MEPLQPTRIRVSIVAAIEHVNALWAHAFLAEDILRDADPEVRRLFYWHFAEEIEHKHVADNALRSLYGDYLTRLIGGLLALPIFYLVLVCGVVYLLACDRQLFRRRHLGDLKYLLIDKRFLWHTTKGLLEYTLPTFRPWDTDDLYLARRELQVFK